MAKLRTYAPTNTSFTYGEMDNNWNTLETRTGQGWNDLVADISIRAGANAPSSSNFIGTISALAFSATVTNECFVNFHMRHDYIAGTMVYPHVHWSFNTTSTGTVRWGFEYTLARRADSTGHIVFGATQTLYIENTVLIGQTLQHKVSESPEGLGILGTDLQEDALIVCRVFRDAEHVNDTFPDDVFLLTADIHYECDTLSTPLRFPPFN